LVGWFVDLLIDWLTMLFSVVDILSFQYVHDKCACQYHSIFMKHKCDTLACKLIQDSEQMWLINISQNPRSCLLHLLRPPLYFHLYMGCSFHGAAIMWHGHVTWSHDSSCLGIILLYLHTIWGITKSSLKSSPKTISAI